MKTEILHLSTLGPEDRDGLFRLFDSFYTHTDAERFQRDLAEKDWVIRMVEGDRVVGFSTQKRFLFSWEDGQVQVLFSGDTIVHPDYWDRSHLAGAFGHLFLRLREESSLPLYWFLISKGFRTYRFLPIFFRRFTPRHDGKGGEFKPLLDALAEDRFGSQYDAGSGLIDFQGRRDRAHPAVGGIPAERMSNPHVAFFARANPRHTVGTELACLAPLSRENLTRCGNRVIEHTNVSWHV